MVHSGKKKHKEKEELPSFLNNIKEPPEDYSQPPKSKSKHYLGPIFFGDSCKDFHPPFPAFGLRALRQGQRHTLDIYKPSIDELFYDYEEEVFTKGSSKKFHPTIKRKKTFSDPYSHKRPDTRKVFPHEARKLHPKEDFGTTTSIIEGETSMEIPLCRFKRIPLCRPDAQPEIEFIMPSDLREEKWKFLSHTEQISHAHFPKQFVSVVLNGPNIPASITITRLQCKRTREYDNIFLKKPEEKEEGKVQDTTAEEEEAEAEESQTEEDMTSESEAQIDEQSLKSDTFSAAARSQHSLDMEKTEEDLDEESEGKQGSYEIDEEFENDGEGEIENYNTEEGETQEEEKAEEMEAQEEGNPDEEGKEGD